MIRVLTSDTPWFSSEPFGEIAFRRAVSSAIERRYEKLVWIAAGERVAYRRVVAITSKLIQDTPDLPIAIATKSQIGPVDPQEIEKIRAEYNGSVPVGYMLCVSVP